MPNTFSHSTRSLNADNLRRSTLWLLAVAIFLGAWIAWLALARVAVYEVTPTARLEVDRAVHPIEAPISGRIVNIQMTVGQSVQVDDLLVELDAESERLQIKEQKDRITGYSSQLRALQG